MAEMHLEAALRDLRHDDPRVRAQAADALGRSAADDRAQALAALARAVDDPHPSVRYAALLSLGELDAFVHTDAVAGRLGDGEPLVREAAAIALGQLGAAARESADGAAERAFDALTRALSAAAPEVRFQALASLVEIDAARAAPLVRPLLDDRDAKVRAQAAAALGDASDKGARDALAARLDDADAVRFEAALALARMGDRRGLPLLLAALRQRERAYDAASAIAGLGPGGDDTLRAALHRELSRFFGDPLVKVRCAEALARAGDPRGRAHLDAALRSRREDVRGLAQSVLETLPCPSS
jgi:HEAT repeat protein